MKFRGWSLERKVDLLIRMVSFLVKEDFDIKEELQTMADDAQALQDAFDAHESSVKDAVAEITRLLGKVGNPGLTAKVQAVTTALAASTQELKDAIASDPANAPAPTPAPTPDPVPAPVDTPPVDGGTPTA